MKINVIKMENYETIRENVYNYLEKKCEGERVRQKYDIIIEEIQSLSNFNYHILIFDRETKEKTFDMLYRKFGEISDCVDRKLEATIMNRLSETEQTPKIYFEDPNGSYRLEEFLCGTSPLESETQFKSDILDQIIEICISYSLISSIFTFKLTSGFDLGLSYKIIVDYTRDYRQSEVSTRVTRNFFDLALEKLYEKAYEKFQVFAEKIRNFGDASNEELSENLDSVEFYMNNFRSMFENHHPKRGYLILNHNDLHKRNILYHKKRSKIFLIDHEFAALNLIGFDFVNYLNEGCFEYDPEYVFNENNFNFNENFKLYLGYIDRFEKERPELNETADGQEILKEVKSMEYFVKLYSIVNLFWILYCVKYLNYENYIERKGFDYFQHALDRIKLYEALPNDEFDLKVSNFF